MKCFKFHFSPFICFSFFSLFNKILLINIKKLDGSTFHVWAHIFQYLLFFFFRCVCNFHCYFSFKLLFFILLMLYFGLVGTILAAPLLAIIVMCLLYSFSFLLCFTSIHRCPNILTLILCNTGAYYILCWTLFLCFCPPFGRIVDQLEVVGSTFQTILYRLTLK